MSLVGQTIGFPIGQPVGEVMPYGGDVVTTAIQSAFAAKGFNSKYSKAYAAYYIQRNAKLDGTVTDERLGVDTSRPELTNRATTFNGTNQYFASSGRITSSGKTALSVAIWAKGGLNDTAISEYATTGNQRSWRIANDGNRVEVILSQDGTVSGSTAKRYDTVDTVFDDGEWHRILFTWSAASDELLIYCDGELAATTAAHDHAITSLHDTTQGINISGIDNGTSEWSGELANPLIWERVLTATEARDDFLGEWDQLPTPDHAWYLVGPKAWDITGNGNHIDGANNPTLSEDKDNPTFPFDFNHAGWSIGNKGRFKNVLTSGESVTFEVETTDTSFNFLNASDGNFAGLVFAGSSGGLGSVTSITIDGELFTGTTRNDLKNAVSDGVKHTVTIVISSSSWPNTEWGNTGGSYEMSTGYLRPTHINGVAITADDIDFDNTTEIVPAQWDSTLDANGNDRQYKGEVARNGQLENGPCIDLDGTNQYGTITNSDDFSGEDWTLSGYFQTDVAGSDSIFSQVDGQDWLSLRSTGQVMTTAIESFQDWTVTYFIDTPYYFTLEKTGTSFTLTLLNLRTGDIQTDTKILTMESASGNFNVGANTAAAGHLDGKIWGLKLDHANGFNCPISEESGTTSLDVSGNGKDIDWQNNPTWSDQDSFFHGESVGYSLYEHASDPDILVPLKSGGTALTITPPAGYTKTGDYVAGAYHNNTQATLKTFVDDSDSEAASFYGASFNGTTSGISFPNFTLANRTIKMRFKFTSGEQTLLNFHDANNKTLAVTINSTVSTSRDFAASSFDVTTNTVDVSTDGLVIGEFYDLVIVLDSDSHIESCTLNGGTPLTDQGSESRKTSVEGFIIGNRVSGFYYAGIITNFSVSGVLDCPLYKDSLDRSANCNHGTDTDVTYLSNAAPSELNPDIAATETLAVGAKLNNELILIGQK